MYWSVFQGSGLWILSIWLSSSVSACCCCCFCCYLSRWWLLSSPGSDVVGSQRQSTTRSILPRWQCPLLMHGKTGTLLHRHRHPVQLTKNNNMYRNRRWPMLSPINRSRRSQAVLCGTNQTIHHQHLAMPKHPSRHPSRMVLCIVRLRIRFRDSTQSGHGRQDRLATTSRGRPYLIAKDVHGLQPHTMSRRWWNAPRLELWPSWSHSKRAILLPSSEHNSISQWTNIAQFCSKKVLMLLLSLGYKISLLSSAVSTANLSGFYHAEWLDCKTELGIDLIWGRFCTSISCMVANCSLTSY